MSEQEVTPAMESQEESFVSVEEASDDEIASYLSQLEEEGDHGDLEAEQPLVDEDVEELAEQTTEQEIVTSPPQLNEETVKAPKEATQGTSEAQWQEIQQALRQQEGVVRQQVASLVHQRKEKIAEIERLRNEANESLSPVEAAEKVQRVRELSQEVEAMDRYGEDLTRVHQSQVTLFKHLKPEEANFDAMIGVLESDGIPANEILQFKANPYKAAPVSTLIQLGKRAAERSLTIRLAEALKGQLAKNKELEGKLKESPRRIVSGIQQAASNPPRVSAKTGGAISTNAPTVSVEKMSDEQLKALQKKFGML